MQTVPLGELGEIVSGSTPKTNTAEFWDGDIPWITPADLSDHEGIYFQGRPKKITKAGFESCSTTMLPAGSILFSSRAPIGHSAVTSYPVCTNQGFKNIIPNKRLDPIYGFFALKYLTPAIVAKGRGATFAEVNKEIVEEIEIPYCDLSEQRRIAGELERADRLRRTRRYALDLSGGFIPAIFQQLFGTNPILMQKWDRKPFGKLLVLGLRNGLSPSTKGSVSARVLTLSAITRGVFDSNASKLAPFIVEPPEDKRVLAKDFLICRGNGNLSMVGSGRFPPHDMPDCVFPDTMIAARVQTTALNKQFLEAVWVTQPLRKQIEASARTTNGTHKINQEGLEDLEIPLPPLPLQTRFAELVARHERLRAVQRESFRQAEHLFQTILHQSFA
jgi:type I restriction enzyme S subunit